MDELYGRRFVTFVHEGTGEVSKTFQERSHDWHREWVQRDAKHCKGYGAHMNLPDGDEAASLAGENVSLADGCAWFFLNEFDKVVGPFPESVFSTWFWQNNYFTRGSRVCRIEFRREEGWVVENAYTFEPEPVRRSAEHLSATKALCCTATAWMLIVAESFAKF